MTVLAPAGTKATSVYSESYLGIRFRKLCLQYIRFGAIFTSRDTSNFSLLKNMCVKYLQHEAANSHQSHTCTSRSLRNLCERYTQYKAILIGRGTSIVSFERDICMTNVTNNGILTRSNTYAVSPLGDIHMCKKNNDVIFKRIPQRNISISRQKCYTLTDSFETGGTSQSILNLLT